jgi:hypothetical protein
MLFPEIPQPFHIDSTHFIKLEKNDMARFVLLMAKEKEIVWFVIIVTVVRKNVFCLNGT